MTMSPSHEAACKHPCRLAVDAPDAVSKQGRACCLLKSDSGTHTTLAVDETDLDGFDCIQVLIDSYASGSALTACECSDGLTVEIEKSRNG